jgi:hypothetical protein
MSRAELAVAILDAIARGDLYDAVMERDIRPKKPVSRRFKIGSG